MLALAGNAPAAATELVCICQQVTVCGADSCDTVEEDHCSSTDIRISTSDPTITLCAFSSCLEGAATLTQIDDTRSVLAGSYRHSTMPERNETSVVVLHDGATGIGVIQTTDEEAVAQYSVICREPG